MVQSELGLKNKQAKKTSISLSLQSVFTQMKTLQIHLISKDALHKVN